MSVVGAVLACSAIAQAEIPLTDPAKTNGWEVTIGGREDAYLSWIFGHTIDQAQRRQHRDPRRYVAGAGSLSAGGSPNKYSGNATPTGALANQITDTNLSTPRVRGGFASSVLTFNVRKQLTPDIKLTIQQSLWAGIQNALVGTGNSAFARTTPLPRSTGASNGCSSRDRGARYGAVDARASTTAAA